MKNGQGRIAEIHLDCRVRIVCSPELIPAPGQYILAHNPSSDDPLADPVFFNETAPDGFYAAPHLPSAWTPGTLINLRGPLGHGFSIPAAARKIALVAFDESPERLRGLIPMAFKQSAEVVLVSEVAAHDLPEAVEVQPLQAMTDICQWADYIAFDVVREKLPQLREKIEKSNIALSKSKGQAQVLLRAPMPCGALAECGICALALRHEWKMICKDGPVFDLSDLQVL